MSVSAPAPRVLVVKRPGRRFFALFFGGLGAVVILVLAAVAFGLAMSARHQAKSLETSLKQSNGQLQALTTKLDATNAKLAATKNVDVSALTKQLTQTSATVKHVKYCLPELTQYMNGLTFQGSQAVTAGYLSGGYITSGFNLSRFCSDILSPPSGGKHRRLEVKALLRVHLSGSIQTGQSVHPDHK